MRNKRWLVSVAGIKIPKMIVWICEPEDVVSLVFVDKSIPKGKLILLNSRS